MLNIYSSVPATQSFINIGSARNQKVTGSKGGSPLMSFPGKAGAKNVGDMVITNSPSLTNLSPQSSQKKLAPFPGNKPWYYYFCVIIYNYLSTIYIKITSA